MKRSSWWPVVVVPFLLGAVGYTAHLDPWKGSSLFLRLADLAKDDPKYPVDLLSGHETKVLSADGEADALLDDGFEYQNEDDVRLIVDQHGKVLYRNEGERPVVVKCGNWSFPGDGPARFLRDGSIFRGDSYTYVVEIYTDDGCSVRKADGRAGPIPLL